MGSSARATDPHSCCLRAEMAWCAHPCTLAAFRSVADILPRHSRPSISLSLWHLRQTGPKAAWEQLEIKSRRWPLPDIHRRPARTSIGYRSKARRRQGGSLRRRRYLRAGMACRPSICSSPWHLQQTRPKVAWEQPETKIRSQPLADIQGCRARPFIRGRCEARRRHGGGLRRRQPTPANMPVSIWQSAMGLTTRQVCAAPYQPSQ